MALQIREHLSKQSSRFVTNLLMAYKQNHFVTSDDSIVRDLLISIYIQTEKVGVKERQLDVLKSWKNVFIFYFTTWVLPG